MIPFGLVKKRRKTGVTVSQPVAVIFESNFANDTGYLANSSGVWNGPGNTNAANWDGVKVGGGSSISVTNQGESGSGNSLKFIWDPASAQPTASFGKHLTSDKDTGFDELYIRYTVKLPNNVRIGELLGDPPTSLYIAHWKWGRLWQNTSPTDVTNWNENRADSGYVVWNWNGNIPYTTVNAVWSENTGANLVSGSSGGERQVQDYFISGADRNTTHGYFESVWDINDTDRIGQLENNTTQTWHTVEWRMKLATTLSSDDGVFEMWVDGVSWGSPTRLLEQGGAPARTGIPTGNLGSGFNFFTFFDNIGGWHRQWGDPGVDGYLLVDDVVVSTDRIGHAYVAGNTDNTGVGAT